MSYINNDKQPANVSPGCNENENGIPKGISPVINPEVHSIINAAIAQPTEADNEREKMIEELRQFMVDLEAVYEEDDTLLKIGGVNAFGRKDIVCIKAKQKNGKTHLNAIIMSAVKSGKWNEVECVAKGAKVLYVDTEQKKRDTQRIVHKALRMAGCKLKNSDDLQVLNLRDVTSPDECRKRIQQALIVYKPDIVIIDGVVDILNDFNDVTESQQLARELMKMADDGNCCIICVLHTNKASDDHNMRGHLGTILAQKASCVLECRKDTKTNLIQVSCTDCRHAPIPDFYFGFDPHGEVISATEIAIEINAQREAAKAQKKADEEEKKLQERFEKTRAILIGNGGFMASLALRKAIEEKQIYSKNYITGFLDTLVKREMLNVTADGSVYSLPKEDPDRYADPQVRLDLE